MDEIERQKRIDDFESSVTWLRKCVPPDDVYDFAEQALMACDYFVACLAEHVNLVEEGNNDKILEMWLRNICSIRLMRDMNMTGIVNTILKHPEDL